MCVWESNNYWRTESIRTLIRILVGVSHTLTWLFTFCLVHHVFISWRGSHEVVELPSREDGRGQTNLACIFIGIIVRLCAGKKFIRASSRHLCANFVTKNYYLLIGVK